MPIKKDKQTFYTVFVDGKPFDVTGRKRTPAGYVALCIKQHPHSDKLNGYIFEHRIVMEMQLGRFLKENEIIHHKNEVKHDNRVTNLEITERSNHTILHHKGAKRGIETKAKMSEKATERLKNKQNHPGYKFIDKRKFIPMVLNYGPTITAEVMGVTRKTVYNKIKEFGIEDEYNERYNINRQQR